jgi:DNA replication protein DnaC
VAHFTPESLDHFKAEWVAQFQRNMQAAVDRIIHHASIIEIEGESYRKKQHLKK